MAVISPIVEEIEIIVKKGIKTPLLNTDAKKGGFKRDGTTHHLGIENEHHVCGWLNLPESFIGQYLRQSRSLIFQHRGGTQTKADAVAWDPELNKEIFEISIKNHKTGTFDWINTSPSKLPQLLQSTIKENIHKIKTSYSLHQNIDKSRQEVLHMCAIMLNTLQSNSEFIVSLLQGIYQNYPQAIIVKCEKDKKLIYFNKSELRELQTFTEHVYFLKHNSNTSSAQIMKRDLHTGEETNTYLRLRIVLNNGVNALLGNSTNNKSSSLCLKIQQDNIKLFLNSIENKVMEDYV
jgi:hypothetical protein